MDPGRIRATYLIETPLEPAEAAAVLAGEQSSFGAVASGFSGGQA